MSPKQLKAAAAAERRLVDEYGDLVAKITPYKPDIARLATLATALRALHADSDAASDFSVEGDHYVCHLGPKSNQTRIEDMQEVYEALGHKLFIEHASITLAALEKSGLQATQIAALTTKEQTGSRSLTVVELAG